MPSDDMTLVDLKLALALDADTAVTVYHPPPGLTWPAAGPDLDDDEIADHPYVTGRRVTIGELVAERLAAAILAGLDHSAYLATAEHVLDDALRAEAAALVARVLATPRSHYPLAKRPDLTLAQMIAAEADRQLNHPDPNAMARGRTGVTVVDAIIATAVTEELRKLTAAEVAQLRARILADIAQSGGRG